MERKAYVEREVKMLVRAGARKGWYEVKIGDKKFIMKQVDSFYTEGEAKNESAA
jgi:hypothetical protein